MEVGENITLINKTKGKLPSLPFADMKNAVLGKDYELSVVFIGNTLSRELNLKWRQKDKPTNILSFNLGEKAGEIFINPILAKKEAPEFERTFSNFIAFLFIHGLFHLKGFDHSSKMESKEKQIREKFGI